MLSSFIENTEDVSHRFPQVPSSPLPHSTQAAPTPPLTGRPFNFAWRRSIWTTSRLLRGFPWRILIMDIWGDFDIRGLGSGTLRKRDEQIGWVRSRGRHRVIPVISEAGIPINGCWHTGKQHMGGISKGTRENERWRSEVLCKDQKVDEEACP